jgi:hypothetical protein
MLAKRRWRIDSGAACVNGVGKPLRNEGNVMLGSRVARNR